MQARKGLRCGAAQRRPARRQELTAGRQSAGAADGVGDGKARCAYVASDGTEAFFPRRALYFIKRILMNCGLFSVEGGQLLFWAFHAHI